LPLPEAGLFVRFSQFFWLPAEKVPAQSDSVGGNHNYFAQKELEAVSISRFRNTDFE